MSFGDKFVTKYKRDSLRILGTVGEPINPEAWRWYHDVSLRFKSLSTPSQATPAALPTCLLYAELCVLLFIPDVSLPEARWVFSKIDPPQLAPRQLICGSSGSAYPSDN